MAKCQIYNSRIDRWVLMDDEKKGGFIKCQKEPFNGVPKKNETAGELPGPPAEKKEPEKENRPGVNGMDSESKKPDKETKKKGGLFSFFSNS